MVLAVQKRLRYFLERDATLQDAGLRLFLGPRSTALTHPIRRDPRGSWPRNILRAGVKFPIGEPGLHTQLGHPFGRG
jgi:hypothetical protein